ncbi:putative SUZ domain-containing protein 1-like [Scophthalmus maximus]|uniref:SUZ RNA-binding domain-containing n=2 Tax=Scophthalmus maximus TaxID=52904 RepID=A0A2U9BGA0_SCOMX|nr:putative SUZ domain-containing protein 1-like [Scophthalmus maximus]
MSSFIRPPNSPSKPSCRGSVQTPPSAPCPGRGWGTVSRRSRRGNQPAVLLKMEDDEVAESWEEAADSGEIERRLEAKLKINQEAKKSSLCSGGSPVQTAIVIQDDSLPAAPPPQIRILKRPSNNGSAGNPASSSRPSQMKSLAQREAEYAEARKRILGSASSDETPQDNLCHDRPARTSAQQPPEPVRQHNHAIRQPTGPDGTSGFRLCR